MTHLETGGGEPDGNAGPLQYVTFHVKEEVYAVPLAEVQEIIRMPDVVQVPKSPASLEGLANLRGAVMSVTSLRRVFGFHDAEHDEATRVVVLNRGVPAGFVVDRMAAVVTVEPGQIEHADDLQATIRSDMLTGMIKNAGGHAMVMILDPDQLLASEFETGRSGGTLGGGGGMDRGGRVQDADATDELQLVSFEVARQEYALPIEHVQEIVQVPDNVSRIPRTDGHVLGVMTLRNRLLPLVSLRAMFGLPQPELDERSRIVVVPLDEHTSVGVVLDSVREVLRVHQSLVDAVPSLLTRGDESGDIKAICRLGDGKRLVSILSAERLFKHDAVKRAIEAHSDQQANDMIRTAQDRTATVDDEEQFVVFRLADEEYGAPIDAVNEIVRVPDELTRVPKTPAFIEGVVNLRGAVLPVIDQRRRFDLADAERNDRQRIMVFTIGGVRTGFIVDSVSEVLKIARSAIGPAPTLSEEQARLISRVANLEKQGRMILLLDIAELLDRREQQALADVSDRRVH